MNLSLPALRQHTARLADHLRLSDTLLQAQSQMGDGLLIIEGHRIVHANGAAAEISGYAVDDLLALESVFDLIPMDERRRLAHRLDRAVSLDRIRNHCESTIVRRDGRRVDLELSVQHVPAADVDVRRVVVIARDVTDRKAMERALRSSEARYRLLFDSTVAGLCVSTIEGRLIQCNTAFARMLGFASAEEALADPQADFDLASPEGGTILGQLRTHGAVVDFEIPLRRRDGSTAWALGNATLLDRFDDGPALVETILIDVTARRALQVQLYESQKMDAIGRLASGVAHDFNNLLTAIQGYSELALSDLGNHPLRAQIEEIGRAAQRATALTRQLLAFSRRQADSLCLVDVNTVVRSMLNLLRRLIGEDFDLVARFDAPFPQVRADEGQLEQVIMNLVVNARDAQPSGGMIAIETASVEVTAAVARRHGGARPGSYVRLRVCDYGTGMSPEVQAHLFEPFFTTKPEGKGTGLGLSTVYGIVQQSGGYIEVESRLDEGTTFSIFLPAAGDRDAAEMSPPATGGREAGAHGTETVLLVEDEGDVRALARLVLERRGYRVLEAAHAPEALQLARSYPGPIDLLVTDVVMPHMNGRALAIELAVIRPEVKVLYMSGYPEEELAGHHLDEGGGAFLAKPFHAEELARRVRDVLDVPVPDARARTTDR
jgi:PAS domain S-box-containing protein